MKKSLVLLVIVFLVAAYVYYFEVREASKLPSTDEKAQTSKTLIGAKKDDIRGFTLARTGSQPISVELMKDEWAMSSPVGSATEQQTVSSILYDIENTNKDLTIEPKDLTPEKLKAFGLDAPAGSVDVTLKDRTLHFIVGGQSLDKSAVYVRAGNDGPVYLVSKGFGDNLETTVFQMRNKTLMPLVAAQVGFVRLSGTTKAAIEKKDGQWNLIEPYADYADPETLTTLVKDANALQVSEFVSDDPATFPQYGLDNPEAFLAFNEAAAGGKTCTINLGKEAPAAATGEKMVYAAMADGRTVYKLRADKVEKLFPALAQLQCKTVTRFDPYALKELTLTYGLSEVQLKRPDYDWKVAKPYDAEADNRTVGEVLAHIKDLRIAGLVTSEPEKDKYGIETPAASISYIQAARAPAGVIFGADAGDGMVYVKRTDTPAVFKVSGEILKKLQTPALKYHSLDMQKVPMTNVDTLTITRGAEVFAVKRQAGARMVDAWKMTKPAEAPANASMMAAVEVGLATIRAVELVEDNVTDPAKYGLDKPSVRIDFEMASGTKPKSLLTGAAADGGKRYAVLEGTQIVFTVAADFGRAILDEVRDTKVFSFKPADVTRVELTTGDRKVLLVKSDKDWKAEAPADRTVSQSGVWGELSHLSQLLTTKFMNYTAADLANYGLDKPQATARIAMPTGVAVLSVGAMAQTGHYYATSTTVTGVFLLTPGDVAKVLEPESLFETPPAGQAPAPEECSQPPAAPETPPQQTGEGAPAATGQ